MTKLIITILLVGLLGVVAPQFYYQYNKVPIQTFTPKIQEKTVVKKIAKKKITKILYSLPTEEVLEIVNLVARETGVDKEIISKIIWAESQYDLDAKHTNKNKSIDHGLFQINSQHIPLAKSMGINIFTPEGNAKFAIYLMKKNGLRDWGYSKSTWSNI